MISIKLENKWEITFCWIQNCTFSRIISIRKIWISLAVCDKTMRMSKRAGLLRRSIRSAIRCTIMLAPLSCCINQPWPASMSRRQARQGRIGRVTIPSTIARDAPLALATKKCCVRGEEMFRSAETRSQKCAPTRATLRRNTLVLYIQHLQRERVEQTPCSMLKGCNFRDLPLLRSSLLSPFFLSLFLPKNPPSRRKIVLSIHVKTTFAMLMTWECIACWELHFKC